MSEPIDKASFVAKFKARMVAMMGEKFDDGGSIAEYADEIAPSYYDDPDQRRDGPEECAAADISYWGDQ